MKYLRISRIMLKRSELTAAILSIVVCSMAYQCAAGYKTAKPDVRERESLSVLLVPFPAPSHMMGMAVLGEELIHHGHNVTFCVAQIEAKYVAIGKEICSRTGMVFLNTSSSLELSSYKLESRFFNLHLEKMIKVKDVVHFTWRLSTISKQVVETLDSQIMRKWDIVIGEYMLWPLVGTIARKWNVPVIHFANAIDFLPSNLPFWPYPLYGTGYTDNPTFFQRLYLALLFPIQKVLVNYFETVVLSSSGLKDERLYILPGTMTPYIVSTSFGFEYPRPLLPLFHYTGPMIRNDNTHISLLEGPLKRWLDSKSNASVILISMGTTTEALSTSDYVSLTNGILATPYSALWSLGDVHLQKLICTVAGHQNKHRFFLSDWMPQQAVAQHSSIGIAILHGGMGGVSQCLYNGIPEIIIPSALDRDDVAARVISRGAGLRLYRHQITAQRLANSIMTVSNPKYRRAAQRLRKTFIHNGGVEKAVELVEFYAEVGYEHLVPAYARYRWSWVQYYNVDVYALFLIILALALYWTYLVCRQGCKCWSLIRKVLPWRLKHVFVMVAVILVVYVVTTDCYMMQDQGSSPLEDEEV